MPGPRHTELRLFLPNGPKNGLLLVLLIGIESWRFSLKALCVAINVAVQFRAERHSLHAGIP